MPKKKKKEKGGGGEDDSADPLAQSIAPGKTASTGGLLSMSSSTSMFNKSSLSSTLNAGKPGFGLTKEDPNLKLLGQSDLKEMERELEAHQRDEGPGMGGGMGVFAINKDGISRAVVKFIDKPKPQPLTVSFQFPGTFLTHKYVMAIIKQHIMNIPDSAVTHVQYMDRNVRLGTRGLENRWLVSVTPMRAKEQLIRQGIKVVNRTIYVKSFDDVTNDEYREYQRYSDLQNKMRMGFGAKNKKPGPASPAGVTAENTTVEDSVPEKIEEEDEEGEEEKGDSEGEDGEDSQEDGDDEK